MTIKKFRHHIRFSIIVPFIFAGIGFLSALLTFRATQFDPRFGQEGSGYVYLWALMVGIICLLCGFLVTRLLLRPVKRFIQRAHDLPGILGPEDGPYRRTQVDEINQLESICERVTDILTQLDARYLFPEIIGDSRVMRDLLHQVQMAASTDSTALITGESGTGKAFVAFTIHQNSSRQKSPFIKFKCKAMSPDRLESALFDHKKGTVTSAAARSPEKDGQAHGGTIFLDEIGDIPLEQQAKMLQIIQEKGVDQEDGTRTTLVDLRLICATKKDLAQMVREGNFHEGLYDCIKESALPLPPLRDRKEDIPRLVNYFLTRTITADIAISVPALQMMMGYDWPGNVRELKNTVAHAAAISQGGEITTSHLPDNIPPMVNFALFQTGGDTPFTIDDNLKDIEKGIIIEALKKTKGIQIRAAELMGINQRSLWHRIKKYQIDAAAFKSDK